MDRDPRKQLDEYRLNQAGELENALIDDFFTGEYSRGDFVRQATMIGLSATAIGAALGAMGYAAAPARGSPQAVKAGGRFKLGIVPAPAKPMEPNLFADHGTLATGSICGEYPHTDESGPDALADARRELEAEREGDGLDVHAPQGSQVRRTARR